MKPCMAIFSLFANTISWLIYIYIYYMQEMQDNCQNEDTLFVIMVNILQEKVIFLFS